MKWETDLDPMTPEKAIKLRAHEFIMRMRSAGVPWAHCNIAALVMVLELKAQFLKIFTGSEADKKKKLQQFELLEQGVKGFLPLLKNKTCKKKD